MGTSRRTAGRYTPPLLLLSPLHVSPLSRILYYGLMLGPETKHPSLSNVAFSLPPLLSEVLLIGCLEIRSMLLQHILQPLLQHLLHHLLTHSATAQER